MIPTKIHGVLDYLMGLFVMASPWLFQFNANGAETWVPVVLGIGVIVYSLMTDYELGIASVFSMVTHLRLDAASGLLLATSPFLFGFQDYVYWPHLILGLMGSCCLAAYQQGSRVWPSSSTCATQTRLSTRQVDPQCLPARQ